MCPSLWTTSRILPTHLLSAHRFIFVVAALSFYQNTQLAHITKPPTRNEEHFAKSTIRSTVAVLCVFLFTKASCVAVCHEIKPSKTSCIFWSLRAKAPRSLLHHTDSIQSLGPRGERGALDEEANRITVLG